MLKCTNPRITDYQIKKKSIFSTEEAAKQHNNKHFGKEVKKFLQIKNLLSPKVARKTQMLAWVMIPYNHLKLSNQFNLKIRLSKMKIKLSKLLARRNKLKSSN